MSPELVQILQIIGYLGSIGSLVGVVPVAVTIYDKLKPKKQDGGDKSCVYTLEEVMDNPSIVMDWRGQREFGFDKNLYCNSTPFNENIAKVIAEPQKAGSKGGTTLVVVSGGFASGKSRMVYEFVRNGASSKGYKKVFVPRLDDIKTADSLEELVRNNCEKKKMSPEDTLVVLDDINNLFVDGVAEEALNALKSLQKNHFRCVATLTRAENGADDFISRCSDHPEDVGLEAERRMRLINISQIKRNSKCHKWACENYQNKGFSPVIGGYVPGLERVIETTRKMLRNDCNLPKLLASIIIGTKYRYKQELTRDFVEAMFKAKWGDDTPDFDKLFATLANLGFIRKTAPGFENFELSSRLLLSDFIIKSGLYILEDENGQIDWLLSVDQSDAVLWQRAVIRSRSVEYICGKLRERFRRGEIPENFILPIAAMLGRGGEEEFEWVKTAVNDGRITPNTQLLCSLLRLASRRADLRDTLVDLANNWEEKYEIDRSAYYYRCVELVGDDYSGSYDRLMWTWKNGNKDYDDFGFFCGALLGKAVTGNAATEFWEMVKKMADEGVPIKLTGKSISFYCANVRKKTRNRLTYNLLLSLFDNLNDHPEWVSIEAGELRDFLSWQVIDNLPTFPFRKQFFEKRLKEYLKNDEHLLGKMLMRVLELSADKYRSNEKYLEESKNIVKEWLTCDGEKDEAWYAGRRKILNKYLNFVPNYDKWKENYDSFNKEYLTNQKPFLEPDTLSTAINAIYSGLRKAMDDDTDCCGKATEQLDSLCKAENDDTDCCGEVSKQLDEVSEVSKQLDEVLKMYESVIKNKKYKVRPKEIMQPHAITTIYSIISELIDRGASDDVINKIEENFVNDDVVQGNPICRAASLRGINDKESMIDAIYSAGEDKSLQNPDHISNMLMVVARRFAGDNDVVGRMAQLLNELNDCYSIISYDYCCQKLTFMIDVQSGNFGSDFEGIKQEMDKLCMCMASKGIYDQYLYRTVIKCRCTDISVALAMLEEASRIEGAWSVKLLRTFLEKLYCTDRERLSADEVADIVVKKIQPMINRNYKVSYESEAKKILSRKVGDEGLLAKIARKWEIDYRSRKYYLNFPFSSLIPADRHRVWDYFQNAGSCGQIGDADLDIFLKRELYCKKNKKGYADDYYEKARREYEIRSWEWSPESKENT